MYILSFCNHWRKISSLCLFSLSIELKQIISGALEDFNGKPLTRKLSPFSSWLSLSHLCVDFDDVLWSGRLRKTFRKFGYPLAHSTFSARLLSRNWSKLKVFLGPLLFIRLKETTTLFCVSFHNVPSGTSAFWPVLCYRGLLRALSRSHFLKMVWWLTAGKTCGCNVGSYVYLFYTFISIFFASDTSECTCCFTDVEVMHSLLMIFESPPNQRCSPEASVLHPKLVRQIFCLADEWCWGKTGLLGNHTHRHN